MVLCKYYLLGKCRFGDRCWNEHGVLSDPPDYFNQSLKSDYDSSYYQKDTWNFSKFKDPYHWSTPDSPSSGKAATFSFSKALEELPTSNRFGTLNQQQDHGNKEKVDLRGIKDDLLGWKVGGQWLFTCYCPIKYKSNFPELEDISQEELRWDAYQALSSGSFEVHVNSVKDCILKIQMKREEISKFTPEICQILEKMHQGIPVQSNSVSDHKPSFQSFSGGSSFNSGHPNPQTSSSSFSFKLAHLDHMQTVEPHNSKPEFFQMQPLQQSSIDGSNKRGFSFAEAFSKYKSESEPTFMQQPSEFAQGGGTISYNHTSQLPENEQQRTSLIPGMQASMTTRELDKIESKTYTPLDLLEVSEKEQYMSEKFTLGKIPIRPPPIELCF